MRRAQTGGAHGDFGAAPALVFAQDATPMLARAYAGSAMMPGKNK
jgi:hypothetical protein